MINRVTENIKFNMITNNLFNVASKYGELMEQLSTQKMINRPSDNPIGTNDILDFRTAITSVQQFKTNIDDANVWLTLTSTNLSGLRNIVDAAKDIAISESGAGGSPETRQASVATLTSLIDEAVTLLNAKNGDNYLFGGSSTDVQPFSSTYSSASVSAVSSAATNVFNGAVTSGGVYTGTENNNYALRIVAGGPLATAAYQISADGGKNWGGLQTDLSAAVSLGDGVSLSFTAGTENLAAGDLFTVNGNAAGYYRGNNDKLNAVIGKNNTLAYNITGAEAFTGPLASAAVIGAGAGLTADDTILLTRGATAGSWVLTSRPNYPAMVITSQTADAVTIDADNDGTNDITINLSGPWSENKTATFSIATGSPSTLSPVNVSGPGAVDLLTTLNALKAALSEPDPGRAQDLIGAQVDNLKNAETQMLQYETQAGAKMNSLKMTGANHDSFKLQMTNMLADVENADLTKLITEFQMKQIAMQASYSMASQIGKMTILDYI